MECHLAAHARTRTHSEHRQWADKHAGNCSRFFVCGWTLSIVTAFCLADNSVRLLNHHAERMWWVRRKKHKDRVCRTDVRIDSQMLSASRTKVLFFTSATRVNNYGQPSASWLVAVRHRPGNTPRRFGSFASSSARFFKTMSFFHPGSFERYS
jgi:hypothetical protein